MNRLARDARAKSNNSYPSSKPVSSPGQSHMRFPEDRNKEHGNNKISQDDQHRNRIPESTPIIAQYAPAAVVIHTSEPNTKYGEDDPENNNQTDTLASDPF